MKIVVLDGITTNPGDLSWDGFREFGELVVYDRTEPSEITDRACGAGVLITNKTVLDAETLVSLPGLRYVGLLSTGVNVVDLKAARACGVTVTNIPAYSTTSVAQLAFAHILNLTFLLGEHCRSVKEGGWAMKKDFCYWNAPLIELEGKTIGIVGYGQIGRATARLAEAFGMRTIATPPMKSARIPGVSYVETGELFRSSDVVSLHCPLSESNRRMLDAEKISLMKREAILINTARGGLIDEPALAEALNSERIYGAGLDVLSSEPPHPDNPLLRARNCFITPHIAWATFAARSRLMQMVVENLRNFLAGSLQNVVN